ncbi:MAG: segregation/condensation protein A [Actinobacteria bacterium]|nr:segregation/condensation protein A [Actinomycetota bacterium]
MTFQVRTTVFEGPLDLLLQLITRHQVEITAVGITGVVAEYLAFLEEMEHLDLDVTSEFLLIAATLIQLKTRSLLPAGDELDLDDELALIEERDRLLSRLLVCVTFKDVAALLRMRMQDGARYVPRTTGFDQVMRTPPAVVEIPATASDLARIVSAVLSRRDAELELDHLDLDLPSVEEAIADLRLSVGVESRFDDLISHCRTGVEVAAYFLALLELARWGLIEVTQRDWLSEIEVRRRDSGEIDLTSEWAT